MIGKFKEINMPSSKSSGDSHGGKTGFGSMEENKKREAASKVGKASHGKSDASKSSTRGSTSAQHAKAGSPSHKKS
jgi:hypothetical protein